MNSNTSTNTIDFYTKTAPGYITSGKIQKSYLDYFIPELNIPQQSNSVIKEIKILNPNKVVGFTFTDGQRIKTICDNNDIFSLEYACFLAYSKKIYKNTLTYEGVIKKVEELQYQKKYVKLVKDAIKTYNAAIKEQKQKEQEKQKKKGKQKKKEKQKERKNNERY